MKLTAVYVEGENGYTAYIDEMKGVITEGLTIEEAEENLFDALHVYLSPDEVIGEKHQKEKTTLIRRPFVSISKAV